MKSVSWTACNAASLIFARFKLKMIDLNPNLSLSTPRIPPPPLPPCSTKKNQPFPPHNLSYPRVITPKCILTHFQQSRDTPETQETVEQRELRDIEQQISTEEGKIGEVEAEFLVLTEKKDRWRRKLEQGRVLEETTKRSMRKHDFHANTSSQSIDQINMVANDVAKSILSEMQELGESTKQKTLEIREIFSNTKKSKLRVLELQRLNLLLANKLQPKVKELQEMRNRIHAVTSAGSKNQQKELQLQEKVRRAQSSNSILHLQLNKTIRFSVTPLVDTSVGGDTLEFVEWKRKPKVVCYEEIRNCVLSKLYPNIGKILEGFNYHSPIYPYLFEGNSAISLTDRRRLDKFLFQDVESRKRFKISRERPFFAFGSEVSSLCEEIKSRICHDLTNFESQLLKIRSVDFNRVNNSLEEMKVSFTFGEDSLSKIFYIVDMKTSVNPEVVGAVIGRTRFGDISKQIDKTLGNERTGYVFVEIPKFYPPTEQKRYAAVYALMKTDKSQTKPQ